MRVRHSPDPRCCCTPARPCHACPACQVERLTTYSDPECGAPLCVLELFERRRDGLARRHILPAAKSSTVTFQPGAAACLRSLRTVRPMGQLGEVDCAFFHEARPDGLMRCGPGEGGARAARVVTPLATQAGPRCG